MIKGVKRSNTGYRGLADISTIQGFELHPRFGYRTRIYLHMWVVRDSQPPTRWLRVSGPTRLLIVGGCLACKADCQSPRVV
jgi:hypothetical protein